MHPTTQFGVFAWNQDFDGYSTGGCAINDKLSGDPYLLESQAGAFAPTCNIWAPRYRQVGILGLVWVNLDKADDQRAKPFVDAFNVAISDVKSAFLQFLEERPDKGRPFIIAGHSQGAIILTKVIKDCLEGTEHQQNFVAAYLAGGYVPADLFRGDKADNASKFTSDIHEMRGPLDSNCIASWDTRIENAFDMNSVHNMGMGLGMWCHLVYWHIFDKYCSRPTGLDASSKRRVQTNPLTWKGKTGSDSDEKLDIYLGAKIPGQKTPVVPPEEKTFRESVKSTDHAVWVKDPRPWLGKNAGPAAAHGNLHPVDIQMWHFNIRDNVRKRAEHFLKRRK